MRIKAVCISKNKGTEKANIHSSKVIEDFGLENDAHAGEGHRQVSLLPYEAICAFQSRGAQVGYGSFGENFVVEGLGMPEVGNVLKCNDVLLVVTQIGKECHSPCTIYHKMGECIMPIHGVFAKVLKGGVISENDEMIVC